MTDLEGMSMEAVVDLPADTSSYGYGGFGGWRDSARALMKMRRKVCAGDAAANFVPEQAPSGGYGMCEFSFPEE